MVVVSNPRRNVLADREKISVEPGKVRTRRVLVVDDELLIRWSLSEGLGKAGFDVVEAEDARGALACFEPGARGVHAVILDLRLPDSADLGVLRRIRELAPAVPVILMTAYGTAETTEDALELGAWHVVSKPFDVHRVVALVEEAVGGTV
jgi:DNA-binding NtrC family response regulator